MSEVEKSEVENKEEEKKPQKKIKPFVAFIAILLVLALVGFSTLFHYSFSMTPKMIIVKTESGISIVNNPEFMEIKAGEIEEGLAELVTPEGGVAIPVEWGDLGKRMIEAGIIDKNKFYTLHEKRGGFGVYEKGLLEKEDNGHIMINAENANTILNVMWALGLANKNTILEEGPMVDERYGGDASKFASTGGWTLAEGSVMDHYSNHEFFTLTDEQQALVEEVSKNIYRPCCGNSVHFPDCNHGMAMLGLMELMASQGATEQEMYDTALAVNSFWFPDNYMTIGKYFAKRGVTWNEIDSKEILGSMYSGSQGYAQIAREVEPVRSGGGGSCGV
ncbi:MAG: hypothetical protein R3346_04860 [Candidatus Spechtbacterales bacterium]|nr:hypothetical protein [Candidatus Spechtbacterales bacterium]